MSETCAKPPVITNEQFRAALQPVLDRIVEIESKAQGYSYNQVLVALGSDGKLEFRAFVHAMTVCADTLDGLPAAATIDPNAEKIRELEAELARLKGGTK